MPANIVLIDFFLLQGNKAYLSWGDHYRIPRDIGDDIELSVWNMTKQDMYLDWMELEAYK